MKYIIQFEFTSGKVDYIKNYSRRSAHCSITPKPHLINPSHIYDDEDSAKRDIAIIQSDMLELFNAKRWRYQSERNRLRIFSDIDRYKVVSHNFDFIYNKNRKSHCIGWVVCPPRTFCHVCGTNILTGKYFGVGQSRICPMCIKTISVDADVIISGAKTEKPEIEKDHTACVFIESMG